VGSKAEWDWRLPSLGDGREAPAGLAERRLAMRGLNALQIIDATTSISDVSIAGVACIVAAAPDARGTLLYLHGGGYRLGEARTWSGFTSRIAAAAKVRVVVPEYRLAPEHPFPAALHDVARVYEELAATPDAKLLVGGDSAGGGLACALVLAAQAARAPAPDGIVLLSPWLDLTHEAASFDRCAATDAAFSLAFAEDAANDYLQGQDAAHPLLSPLRADLAHFPPSVIAASAAEVLVDQSLQFATALAQAGRPVTLQVEAGLPHVWPIVQPASSRTAALIEDAAVFIRRLTGDTP